MSAARPPAIAIVTPAARGSRAGNRATAVRWAGLLRQCGLAPFVTESTPRRPAAALLAVHARKSADAVAAFASGGQAKATAVLLAGTDVYPEFRPDAAVLACLRTAHRIIALQPLAVRLLPPELAPKARVLVQSATAIAAARATGVVQACVLAHLRAVKDPLLPFAALAHLPQRPGLRILLAGEALDPELGARARRPDDGRAQWLGALSRRAARALLATSHLCIVPSLGEGGSNVLSEAIAAGTPPIATAIPGNVGILGDDWPALFAPGDAAALASLLDRWCADPTFRGELLRRTVALQPLVQPQREREGLRSLLRELGVACD